MAGNAEPERTPSDEALWDAFVGGDDSAIEGLMERYTDLLYWYLLLSTGRPDAAARHARDVWARLAAWRSGWQGFGSFKEWLFAVATQNAVPPTHPEDLGLVDLIDEIKRGQPRSERARTFYAIRDLERRVRQPLLLVAVVGLSVEQAARACNYTVEKTLKCLSRGLAQLARAVPRSEEPGGL